MCRHSACILCTCCDGRLSWFDGAEFAISKHGDNVLVCYFPHDGTGCFLGESLRLQAEFAVELLGQILRQDNFLYIWAWHWILREWFNFVSDYATFCIDNLSGLRVYNDNYSVYFRILFDKTKSFRKTEISKMMSMLKGSVKLYTFGKTSLHTFVYILSSKYHIVICHASYNTVCFIEELHFRYTICPIWVARVVVILKKGRVF